MSVQFLIYGDKVCHLVTKVKDKYNMENKTLLEYLYYDLILGGIKNQNNYNEHVFSYGTDRNNMMICPNSIDNRQIEFNPGIKNKKCDIKHFRETNLLPKGLNKTVMKLKKDVLDNYSCKFIPETIFIIDDTKLFSECFKYYGVTLDSIYGITDRDLRKKFLKEYYKNYFSLDFYSIIYSLVVEHDGHDDHEKFKIFDMIRDRYLQLRYPGITIHRIKKYTHSKCAQEIDRLEKILPKCNLGKRICPDWNELVLNNYIQEHKDNINEILSAEKNGYKLPEIKKIYKTNEEIQEILRKI